MFDRLFQSPFVLNRQRSGPLAHERRRYLVHCAEQQMSRETLRRIARYTLVAAEALRLAERPGVEVVSATGGQRVVTGPTTGSRLRLPGHVSGYVASKLMLPA